jgi:hypothetical protein
MSASETQSTPAPQYENVAPSMPTPADPARRSPLALVSFISGIVTVVFGAILTLVVPFLVSSQGMLAFNLMQIGNISLTLVFGLLAVVLGTIVLLKKGAPKGLAAAGTALGGSALFGAVIGFVQAALYSMI